MQKFKILQRKKTKLLITFIFYYDIAVIKKSYDSYDLLWYLWQQDHLVSLCCILGSLHHSISTTKTNKHSHEFHNYMQLAQGSIQFPSEALKRCWWQKKTNKATTK